MLWGSEMSIPDYFLYTQPEVARSMVRYRIEALPGTLKKAEDYGWQGAFDAWESQEGGFDACSDYNATEVFTKRPMRAFFKDKQVHISAAVARVVMLYTQATGDAYAALCAETDAESLLTLSAHIPENLYVPRPDAAGIIPRFNGCFGLEDATPSQVRERLLDPREYWGGACHTLVLKQAGVVAMLEMFHQDYSSEVMEKSWACCEPRTEHGPSLSACIYALLACRLGLADLAYPFFLKSAQADWVGGGFDSAGLGPAALCGKAAYAVKGFAELVEICGS